MNKILNLRVYTPNELFIDEVITKISVLGNEGYYTILPNHIDYVSSFGDGILCFVTQDNKRMFVGVNQGILVKCGREIQISTFNAINGGSSVEELKDILKDVIKKEEEIINFEKKLKISLKNIEFELFKRINSLRRL